MLATQVLYRYMLLDQLMAAMDPSHFASPASIPRSLKPEAVIRVDQLLSDLNPWDKPILTLEKAISRQHQPTIPNTIFATRAERLTEEQALFQDSLRSLSMAGAKGAKMRLDSVLLNIHLMAFKVRWQSMVRNIPGLQCRPRQCFFLRIPRNFRPRWKP